MKGIPVQIFKYQLMTPQAMILKQKLEEDYRKLTKQKNNGIIKEKRG